MNKNDLRYKRTDSIIRSSFKEMLERQPFSEITINDIADAAMINRSTFYLHYNDKNTLVADVMDEYKRVIYDPFARGDGNFKENFADGERFVKRNRMLLAAIFELRAEPDGIMLKDQFFELLTRKYALLHRECDDPQVAIEAKVYAAAGIAYIEGAIMDTGDFWDTIQRFASTGKESA